MIKAVEWANDTPVIGYLLRLCWSLKRAGPFFLAVMLRTFLVVMVISHCCFPFLRFAILRFSISPTCSFTSWRVATGRLPGAEVLKRW